MFTKEIINILNDKDYKNAIFKLSAISEKFCNNTEIETLSVMRNLMAHGLLIDDEFNSTNAMAVWWYTLKMCCDFSGGFIKRLNEQSED